MQMDPVIIIGTGLAGYSAAREFRKLDRDVPLLMLTADDGAYYTKPQLSNALAHQKSPEALVNSGAAEMAGQLNARILPHLRVDAIDPAARLVRANGQEFHYSSLVLALGADPIRLPLAGNAADDVLSVNDLAGYARFRARTVSARRVLILGAGLVGCEFANDLCGAGYEVDVADVSDQPLGRHLPPRAAAYLRQALEAAGVRWHFKSAVEAVERQDGHLRVRLATGATIEADIVLSAVGLKPRTALAGNAGLRTARGIVTDRSLQASAPGIYALGDCAEVGGLVLPFVAPILQAARALARSLAGTATPVNYPAMPVAVKTPACPVVTCPPRPGVTGTWTEETIEEGVRALFHDQHGILHGFALAGSAASPKERLALAKDLPPWLD